MAETPLAEIEGAAEIAFDVTIEHRQSEATDDREPVTSNYALLDGPYRALILAKALANICNATIPAINQILINLFGPTGPLPVPGNAYCTDGLNMTMTYTFSGPLDPVQTAIVYQSGVLPKPAGVSATVVQL